MFGADIGCAGEWLRNSASDVNGEATLQTLYYEIFERTLSLYTYISHSLFYNIYIYILIDVWVDMFSCVGEWLRNNANVMWICSASVCDLVGFIIHYQSTSEACPFFW
jgi:hypothetical protein